MSILEQSIEKEARGEREKNSLIDFLRDSPLRGAKIEIERSQDSGREVAL